MLQRIERVVSTLFTFLIIAIRPWLGPATCRFYEGCTTYMLRQFREQPFPRAFYKCLKRLVSCNPFW